MRRGTGCKNTGSSGTLDASSQVGVGREEPESGETEPAFGVAEPEPVVDAASRGGAGRAATGGLRALSVSERSST